MWIFGYGSLIWKADFPYVEKLVGYVKGFHRRFYQLSTDHRGVPGKPGRVVTLVPSDDKEARVYGVAYKIAPEEVDNVIKHLDYREKGGYEKKRVLLYPRDEKLEPFEMIIYLANHTNPQYAGPADMMSIAKQVFHSVGPSGYNAEYVFNLANSMRDIAPEASDDHLFELEKLVRFCADEWKLDHDYGP